MASYPLAVVNAYADLVARHRDRRRPSIEGTIVEERRGDGVFFMAKRRIGARVASTYIGADTPETRARVATARAEQAEDLSFQRAAAGLVRICAAAGLPTPDRTTGALFSGLARAGLFRLGGVLIGTHAYRAYEAMLGAKLGAEAMATEDVDIGHPRSVALAAETPSPALTEVFAELGLAPAFSALEPSGGVWRWRRPDGALVVEFLTPRTGEGAAPQEILGLGVHAMGLRFLEYLLHDPLDAVLLYREGVLARVPDPARFGVHKLLVASRRTRETADKARKDIAQAAALLTVLLEDRPFDLEAALVDARERGPSWQKGLAAGAARLPQLLRDALSL